MSSAEEAENKTSDEKPLTNLQESTEDSGLEMQPTGGGGGGGASPPARTRTATVDEMPSWQITGMFLLEHPLCVGLTTGMTIYALFGDDIRQWGCDANADAGFEALSTVAFVVFVLEFLLSCAVKPGYLTDYSAVVPDRVPMLAGATIYLGSFYFWLDLMATLSLILEIPWMYPAATDPRIKQLDLGSSSSALGNINGELGKNARAGRTARSARGARVLRLIRLVRLIKFFRIFNQAVDKTKDQKVVPVQSRKTLLAGGEAEEPLTADPPAEEDKPARRSLQHHQSIWDMDEDEDMPAESEIGKRVSELTTRNVIVGVLTMLIILPLIQSSTSNDSDLHSLRLVHRFFEKNATYDREAIRGDYYEALTEQTSDFLDEYDVLTLWFEVTNTAVSPQTTTRMAYNDLYNTVKLKGQGDLRGGDTLEITITSTRPEDDRNFKTFALLDDSEFNKSNGMFGFILTIFVIIVLVGATATFNMDVNVVVILPIENMIARVKEISEDPMATSGKGHAADTKADGMETTFLLRTIDKIGDLMRIGFGEAGAEIIARNLRDTKPGEKLNLLGGSREIHSIFGFCDIRNFTDTTECLQEEVMTFVNSVAHILHAIVKDCNGAANKNIGDAFLLSWRLPEEPVAYAAHRDSHAEKDKDLFDKALYAFTRFSIDLKIHDAFLTQFSPLSARRLYERMPGYTPRMGMGLHVGKAVEGAIGSDKKIDATYISRAVNYSEFLESSTKTYKVPLLMSGMFFDALTSNPKSKCRKVDVVRTPVYPVFEMYTYDMDLDASYGPKRKRPMTANSEDVLTASNRRISRSTLKKKASHRDLSMGTFRDTEGGMGGLDRIPAPIMRTTRYRRDIWDTDKYLMRLRQRVRVNDDTHTYNKAMDAWQAGDWPAATELFEKFQAEYREANGPDAVDGPSAFQLEFMASHPNGTAPEGWEGIHDA